MDANLKCAPCVLRQTLETAENAEASDATRERVLRRAASEISGMSFDETPMAIASRTQSIVREETGDSDPFAEQKRVANETVAALLADLRADMEDADNRFERAVRLSIAGNVIDSGPGHDIDIEATIEEVLERPFAIDRLEELRTGLEGASDVLYLADNAGEIVLDRLLIEQVDADVEVVVKGQPFLNDVTRGDVRDVDFPDAIDLRTRGEDGIGTITDEFERRLKDADVVISKGQGNYELFSDVDANIYFLFMVKCPVVADSVDAPEGSIIIA